MNRIGIVGGGQLGRMLVIPAKRLGFEVTVLDSNRHCPAYQVGAEEITADLQDAGAIRKLAKRSDFLTVEIEHLNAKVLAQLEKAGNTVHPSAKTIQLIQDKLTQNQFLQRADLPIARFLEINSLADAFKAFETFCGKMVLKTRFGGYDGRGNRVVTTPSQLKKALSDFGIIPLYAEEWIDFKKELAIMVARDSKGKITSYPIVETIHKRNICHEVLAPAPVAEEIRKKAEAIARRVVNKLGGGGVFGVEMFLTKDNRILINEIAPRVHNSGHYTIEACATSQFEQHVRAVTGLPLGNPDMKVPAAVMINILGDRDGPTKITGLEAALKVPNVSVHLYGKSPTKVDRKMGHITAVAATIEEAKHRAEKARRLISV